MPKFWKLIPMHWLKENASKNKFKQSAQMSSTHLFLGINRGKLADAKVNATETTFLHLWNEIYLYQLQFQMEVYVFHHSWNLKIILEIYFIFKNQFDCDFFFENAVITSVFRHFITRFYIFFVFFVASVSAICYRLVKNTQCSPCVNGALKTQNVCHSEKTNIVKLSFCCWFHLGFSYISYSFASLSLRSIPKLEQNHHTRKLVQTKMVMIKCALSHSISDGLILKYHRIHVPII